MLATPPSFGRGWGSGDVLLRERIRSWGDVFRPRAEDALSRPPVRRDQLSSGIEPAEALLITAR